MDWNKRWMVGGTESALRNVELYYIINHPMNMIYIKHKYTSVKVIRHFEDVFSSYSILDDNFLYFKFGFQKYVVNPAPPPNHRW